MRDRITQGEFIRWLMDKELECLMGMRSVLNKIAGYEAKCRALGNAVQVAQAVREIYTAEAMLGLAAGTIIAQECSILASVRLYSAT